MSTLETRYGSASPRTAEFPRAFTLGEFARGAGLAFLWFQPAVIIAAAIGSAVEGGADFELLFIIPVAGAPTGFVATVLGSPAAFLIGFVLRRQARDAVHVIAFAAYGALVGTVTVFIIGGHQFDAATTLTYGIPAAAAVALGWWSTSRLALRKDRRVAPTDATFCGIRRGDTA